MPCTVRQTSLLKSACAVYSLSSCHQGPVWHILKPFTVSRRLSASCAVSSKTGGAPCRHVVTCHSASTRSISTLPAQSQPNLLSAMRQQGRCRTFTVWLPGSKRRQRLSPFWSPLRRGNRNPWDADGSPLVPESGPWS